MHSEEISSESENWILGDVLGLLGSIAAIAKSRKLTWRTTIITYPMVSLRTITIWNVDVCARDCWDVLQSWRLFQLACCQRRIYDDAVNYLQTLSCCFVPRLAPRSASEGGGVTPLDTAILFQRDLEKLVEDVPLGSHDCGTIHPCQGEYPMEEGSVPTRHCCHSNFLSGNWCYEKLTNSTY